MPVNFDNYMAAMRHSLGCQLARSQQMQQPFSVSRIFYSDAASKADRWEAKRSAAVGEEQWEWDARGEKDKNVQEHTFLKDQIL